MSGLDHYFAFFDYFKKEYAKQHGQMWKCYNAPKQNQKHLSQYKCWVYSYELFKTGESTKTESGLVVAWGWAGEGGAWVSADGTRSLWGMMAVKTLDHSDVIVGTL